MERDFMGLNLKDSVIVVKEEAIEICKEPAFSKGSAVQWPLSNTFDTSKSCQAGEVQSAHSFHLHHDTKKLQGSNQAVPVTMSNPFLKIDFSGGSQNFAGAPIKQQLLGGVPVSAPHSILPSINSFAGTTEPWFNSKASCAPAQLTIFYGGTVTVYDDISPEKAQAIMFLAGNGSCAGANTAQPRAQVQVPTSKMAAGGAVILNQHINTPPCSGLSSPMSVSSHPVGQSVGGPTNFDEPARSTGGSVTPVNKVDSPRLVSSLGPVTMTAMMPSAVPQARKASLARFLEKRKERVMNSALAPYSFGKKSAECTANRGSNGSGFLVGSGVGE